MSFTHLHLHDNYSFLEGLGKPKEFIKKAKELGMTALAQTNSGNLYGSFDFYKNCKESGLKPIIGLEASISKKGMGNKDKDNEYYNIVLLAKNHNGYKNLIQLVTNSYLHGFYYRPRIDFDLLKKYSSDLIALSGCTLGEIPQHIITGKKEEFILERIEFYGEIFGKDDFYLEIQEHSDRGGQGMVNDYIVKLAKKHSLKIVATNDCHYVNEDDSEAQDMLFCIGDGRALEDPDRPTLVNGNYALRSEEEMKELFIYAPEAIETTQEIVDKIDLEIPYGKILIPECTLSEDDKIILERYKKYLESRNYTGIKNINEEEWHLRYLCFAGLNKRYDFGLKEEQLFEFIIKKEQDPIDKKLDEFTTEEFKNLSQGHFTDHKNEIITKFTKKQKEIINRLEYELLIVDLMEFNGYFVIVADYRNWAKDN
ncbi:MAG: PHP domain-containing protein, partial [Candidatus Gracilibacteria bacterium]|nr:PHP domain-containing protein [Candidatus Gracilibacteria bacterium]